MQFSSKEYISLIIAQTFLIACLVTIFVNPDHDEVIN